jgi:hypothetical protein
VYNLEVELVLGLAEVSSVVMVGFWVLVDSLDETGMSLLVATREVVFVAEVEVGGLKEYLEDDVLIRYDDGLEIDCLIEELDARTVDETFGAVVETMRAKVEDIRLIVERVV